MSIFLIKLIILDLQTKYSVKWFFFVVFVVFIVVCTPPYLINSLKSNAENLESRCEELSKQIDELQQKYDAERRKIERILQEKTKKNELQKVELKPINYSGDEFDGHNVVDTSACVSVPRSFYLTNCCNSFFLLFFFWYQIEFSH